MSVERIYLAFRDVLLLSETKWQSLWSTIDMMGNQITRGFLATLSLLPAISGAIPTTSELPLSGGLTILSYNDLTSK